MVDSSVIHSSGAPIDSQQVTTDVGSVERQVVALADPTNADAMPAAKNVAPDGTEYGLIVRAILAQLPALLSDEGNLKVDIAETDLGSFPLPPNAATETTLASINGRLPVALIGGKLAVDLTLLQAQLPATLTPGGFLKVSVQEQGVVVLTQDAANLGDNQAFTDGTSPLHPAGFVFDEVAGTALTENDIAAGRVDAKRAQVGVIEDATTRGQRAVVSAAGALKVDADTELPAPTSWADGSSEPTIPAVHAYVVAIDQDNGSYRRLRTRVDSPPSTEVAVSVRVVEDGPRWAKYDAPAAATQAVATQSAPSSGYRLVCLGGTVTLSSSAAPTVGIVEFQLVDDVGGTPVVLWSAKASLPAVAGECVSIALPSQIQASDGKTLTVRTAAAPPAAVVATVAMNGTTRRV